MVRIVGCNAPRRGVVERNVPPRVFEQRNILVDDSVIDNPGVAVPPQQLEAPTKKPLRDGHDIATVRVEYPSHEFVPFEVIGANPTDFLQTSRASFEREVHHAFTGEIWHVRNRFLRVPLPFFPSPAYASAESSRSGSWQFLILCLSSSLRSIEMNHNGDVPQ